MGPTGPLAGLGLDPGALRRGAGRIDELTGDRVRGSWLARHASASAAGRARRSGGKYPGQSDPGLRPHEPAAEIRGKLPRRPTESKLYSTKKTGISEVLTRTQRSKL